MKEGASVLVLLEIKRYMNSILAIELQFWSYTNEIINTTKVDAAWTDLSFQAPCHFPFSIFSILLFSNFHFNLSQLPLSNFPISNSPISFNKSPILKGSGGCFAWLYAPNVSVTIFSVLNYYQECKFSTLLPLVYLVWKVTLNLIASNIKTAKFESRCWLLLLDQCRQHRESSKL